MKKTTVILALTGLLGFNALGTISVQSWYRLGESGTLGSNNRPLDAAGNNWDFPSSMPSAAYFNTETVTGVLGQDKVMSLASLEFGRSGVSGFWGAAYSTPTDNFGMEVWVKPVAGAGDGWIYGAGAANGNPILQVNNGRYAASLYYVGWINTGAMLLNTNEWTHLALVVTNGVARFYVNGAVQTGSATGVTPGSAAHLGVTSGGGSGFKGLIDEARIFTFNSGEFSTNDLLLVTGPVPTNLPPTIIMQPKDVNAEIGDAAVFNAPASGAAPLVWRWYLGDGPLSGATNPALSLASVTTHDAGGYYAIITNNYGSVTSRVAALTVKISLTPSLVPNTAQTAQIDRKYGMFCHYGINTFLNVEWSDGSYSPTNYAPTVIDTDQWARTARQAGMRYLICITKHHDGFCMWPSAYTTYGVAHSGNTNDVVRLLADSCAKYGIKLAMYYSLWDRHEPTYTANFDPGYITYMTNQLTELLSNYGPVSELWLDGSWDKPNTAWQVPLLYDLVKRLQPDCQMSINWNIGAPGNVDSSVNLANQQNGYPIRYFPSDFRLGDPDLPVFPDPKLFTRPSAPSNYYYLPFEATITLDANNHWFYHLGDSASKALGTLENWWNRCTAQSNLLIFNAAPSRDGTLLPSNTNILTQLASRLGLEPGRPFPVNLAEGRVVTANSIWQNDTNNYGPAQAVDANPDTRWASGLTNGWLEIDFGVATTFSRVIINEYLSRIQSFTFDYWNGTAWQTITNGSTIGESARFDFPPVTGSRLRLNIYAASDAPSLWMFKVHAPSPPPVVNINVKESRVVLAWPYGTLQSASNLSGPFSDVPLATSPWTNVSLGEQEFFRLRD